MATARDTKDTDDLAKQIEKLQADVAELTQMLGDIAKGKAADLKDEAGNAAERLGKRGEHALRDAAEQIGQMETNTAEYVRTRPIQALAIAAGLGLLVGFLTRPR